MKMTYSSFQLVIALVIVASLLLIDSDIGVHGLSVPGSFNHRSKQKTTKEFTSSGNRCTETTRREAFLVATSSSLLLLLPPPIVVPFTVLPTARAATVNDDKNEYQDGPEGIRYKITEQGDPNGIKPQRAQPVQTLYTLYINGFPDEIASGSNNSKQIDSTSKFYGQAPFMVRAGVGQVIRGWDLSLLDMVQGEARRLIIPSALGYGDKGMGPIPGGATLYFEIKLVKVEEMKELSPEAKAWLLEHPL